MIDLSTLTIAEASRRVARKEISPVELTRAALGRIARLNPDLNAFVTVLDEQATAWNKGDLDGFMKGYWNSKDLTFYSGKDKQNGWQATIDRYKKR